MISGAITMPDNNENRRFLYSFKILGILWFNDSLPDDLAHPVDYVINPTWQNNIRQLATIRIESLGEQELAYICNKLKKPRWVNRSGLRGKLTFQDNPLHE